MRARATIGGTTIRAILTGAVASAAMAAAASDASAAVTIGSNLAVAPNASFSCGAGCTFIQGSLAPAQQLPAGASAPGDGVIVRWRIRSGATPEPSALRVLHRVDATTFTGAGASTAEIPAASAISSFATRLPIKAGDVLGLNSTKVYGVAGGGLNTLQISPVLADGATESVNSSGNQDLAISADIEPDADGDGFGDESQDACPTDVSAQGPCPDRAAPETTITRKPKRRTRSRRARVAFASSEAGSTFECRVGSRRFRSCISPARLKLKRGKNVIEVRATDAAGNVDATPARAKVRRRR